MKKITAPKLPFVSFLSVLALLTPACAAIDFDQGVEIQNAIRSLQQVAAPPAIAGRSSVVTPANPSAPAEWTVMVYVNGKNDLEQYGLLNINQMESVGSTDRVKIAVEFGRAGYSNLDGGWKGVRRYIIQKDNDPNQITSPVLQQLTADMGDWQSVVDFVNWAKQTAPANHYMLIMWDHGSGWQIDNTGKGVTDKSISFDYETGHSISTWQLAQALQSIGHVDIYASDACLMQMVEIDYQIRNYADLVVGSEELEPDEGWSYDAFLGPLSANPEMAPEQIAANAVNTYAARYRLEGGKNWATQSTVRMSELPDLKTVVDNWTAAVMSANETGIIKPAVSKTRTFNSSPGSKDLLDLVRNIDARTQNGAVKSTGADLENFLTQKMILSDATYGPQYKDAFGLAVYLPTAAYNADYNSLDWAKDSNWRNFIDWVVAIYNPQAKS